MNVVTRFPPSPTGYCHVGTARMAVLNYLFTRKHGGKIIFRSEDTDRARSTREFEDDIVEQLKWLGLSWDEFYRQSERTSLYRAEIEKLLTADKAYVSHEESKKKAGEKVEIIRLRNPGRVVTFNDVLRGDITFDTTELKDFAIARRIDDPLYHLSVVIDDALMGVTHVIRGEDHISNTPRQILIQEALGVTRPIYVHYPLHLSQDRSKLSKRTGDVAVRDYRAKGYLPEALLNYIAVLGWTPPSGREILSLDEMIPEFDLKDLHKSGAVFDPEKLRWYNREYLLSPTGGDFAHSIVPVLESAITARGIPWDAVMWERLLPLLRERVHVAEDVRTMVAEGELDYFFTRPRSMQAEWTADQKTPDRLARLVELLRTVAESDFMNPEAVKAAIWDYATEEGRKNVLQPLREILSGKKQSPDPFTIASVIGKTETIDRLTKMIDALT